MQTQNGQTKLAHVLLHSRCVSPSQREGEDEARGLQSVTKLQDATESYTRVL